MAFDTSYYKTQKFACGKKGCSGTLIPVQIRENKKDGEVKVFGKCPECKKVFQFSLSLNKSEVDKWQPVLEEQTFKCTECGQSTLKTEKVLGNPRSDYKIKVECVECKKEDDRAVDGGVYFLVENKLPSAERTIITCPTCNTKVTDESAKKCPNCGRDLFCGKCGSLLSAKASFCMKCGSSAEKGDFTKKPIQISKDVVGTCPNCGANLTPKAKFCNECGQELFCNKCGNPLPVQAVFCNLCGDPVRIGKKPGPTSTRIGGTLRK
nr:zinc ribbon domain-containing protein [Candidatus Sigynarchaeota archaeon]